jgi:hypothetical protein
LIRLYLDEDSMDNGLVRALRSAAFDVVTTSEAAMRHQSDDSQFEFARARGMVIYTANARDYVRLHGEAFAAGLNHAGIIVCTRQSLPIGDQFRGIQAFAAQYPLDDDWINRLEFLKAAR